MYGFIADVHLFTKLPNEDYLKSLKMFLDIIRKQDEVCYGIFVCGDLFDHRGNNDELKFACRYILELVYNHCGKDNKNAPVYFVHGTFSHDHEQYEIFFPLLSKLPDIEVHYVKHVTAATTHAGHKILYLPQEYGNIDYSEFFKKKYDIIVGHGPIGAENKAPCKSHGYEIMHSVETLGKISTLCVFGHYHDYTDFGNGVYYVGANLRWKYGEDEPCVFFICDNDLNVKTFPNPVAKEFKSIYINSPEELRAEIAKEDDSYRRFIITANDPETLSTYHAIMGNMKNNDKLTFRITSDFKEDDNEDHLPDIDPDELSQTSSGLDPVQSLIAYIQEKHNMDTTEQVREYEQKIRKDIESDS